MIDQHRLFIEVAHQLRSYRNAAVLYALLEARADEAEFKKSVPMLSFENLRDWVSVGQVRRALAELADIGLISTRAYPNLKTYFTVNRDAVLELLSRPHPDTLPGLRERDFPFLAAWKAQTEQRLADTSEPGSSPNTGTQAN